MYIYFQVFAIQDLDQQEHDIMMYSLILLGLGFVSFAAMFLQVSTNGVCTDEFKPNACTYTHTHTNAYTCAHTNTHLLHAIHAQID